MTEIITIASSKGGNGKTEFAKRITKFLIEQDNNVLVLDLDITNELYNYYTDSGKNTESLNDLVQVDNNLLALPYTQEKIEKLKEMDIAEIDFVVIDTPPIMIKPYNKLLFSYSDKVIIPIDMYSERLLKYNETLPEIANIDSLSSKPEIDLVINEDKSSDIDTEKIKSMFQDNEYINVLDDKILYGNYHNELDKAISYNIVIKELFNK